MKERPDETRKEIELTPEERDKAELARMFGDAIKALDSYNRPGNVLENRIQWAAMDVAKHVDATTFSKATINSLHEYINNNSEMSVDEHSSYRSIVAKALTVRLRKHVEDSRKDEPQKEQQKFKSLEEIYKATLAMGLVKEAVQPGSGSKKLQRWLEDQAIFLPETDNKVLSNLTQNYNLHVREKMSQADVILHYLVARYGEEHLSPSSEQMEEARSLENERGNSLFGVGPKKEVSEAERNQREAKERKRQEFATTTINAFIESLPSPLPDNHTLGKMMDDYVNEISFPKDIDFSSNDPAVRQTPQGWIGHLLYLKVQELKRKEPKKPDTILSRVKGWFKRNK